MRFQPSDDDLDFAAREVSVRVDFDQLDTEGRVEASLRFVVGPNHPVAGDVVLMFDGVAGSCFGRVAEVIGWLAWIEPDWESWTPLPPRLAPLHAREGAELPPELARV